MTDKYTRRGSIAAAAGLGLVAAVAGRAQLPSDKSTQNNPMIRDKGDPIRIGFLLDEGATVIDFTGPWEVFQDADFHLFTVAPSRAPLRASGGLKIVPDHTLQDAPAADVIVIPAQGGSRDPTQVNGFRKAAWLRERHKSTELIMSVCTGAFLLAYSGLLDGLSATTHHQFFDDFAATFPKVKLVRDARFVENGSLMSTGGLSSGIDGALRVVKRFKGTDEAIRVATYMEYTSRDFLV